MGNFCKIVKTAGVESVGFLATVASRVDKKTGGFISFIGRNTLGRVYQLGNWIYDKIN